MTVTKIVQRINNRMNYDSFSYSELTNALDAAIDYINTSWRVNLPVITDLPETIPDTNNPGSVIPSDYTNLPDEFIRQFVVPFACAYQYTINEQDSTPESNEALINFGKLSERYGSVAGSGATEITGANFDLLTEDRSGYFGDGNSNYAYKNDGGYLGPLTLDEGDDYA